MATLHHRTDRPRLINQSRLSRDTSGLADAFQHLMAARVTVVTICQLRLYVRRDDSDGQAPATFDYQRQQTELDWCV